MRPNLLITAGGSDGYSTLLWTTELATLVAQIRSGDHGWPPALGTSSFNGTERRYVSPMSMNGRGRPLTSPEAMVETIAATKTTTGLSVRAERYTNEYLVGIEIPVKQIRFWTTVRSCVSTTSPEEWTDAFRSALCEAPQTS